jgi:hypothetical protein
MLKVANMQRWEIRDSLAFVFLILTILLAIGNPSHSQTNESGGALREIRKLERAWRDAYEAGTTRKQWTQSSRMILLSPFPNGANQTKSQIMNAIRTPPNSAKPQKFYTEDVQGRVYADNVILTDGVVSESLRDGKPIKEQMLYTDTYVRRNGRWQVFASHLSNPTRRTSRYETK